MSTCSEASAASDPGRHQRPGRGRPHRRHHHVAAARLLRETDDRFLVTPTVPAETCYLLHEFGGPAPKVAFLRSSAAGELELAVLTVADVARMAELAERLGVTTLATFDRRHFTVVRPAHTPSFALLPA